MRTPLKFQIMLPLAGVMLLTVILVTAVNVWLAGSRARQQIEEQLQGIGDTLAGATFPLTDNVLKQMRGLSGTEFAVVDRQRTISAASGNIDVDPENLSRTEIDPAQNNILGQSVMVNGDPYFHMAVNLRRPTEAGQSVLHVFYPQAKYEQVWKDAVLPPMAVGILALILVVLLSSLIALRLTRPIHRLRDQVDRVARGDFIPFPIPHRDDELRDLSTSVNRMAEMLAQYESDVRRNERLRTLDQLGGGIAHQLRNSVTGCRMAIDLHYRHCPLRGDESFVVAIQQLESMEEYLRRFLALGKQTDQRLEPLDVGKIVENVLPLLYPRAKHLSVTLQWHPPAEPLMVSGNADALSQVVANLVLNAFEAVSERSCAHSDSPVDRRVDVHLRPSSESEACLEVHDSGNGPDDGIKERIFEPLVTSKPDGVGLGLCIAREIIEQHRGCLEWRRHNELTCFSVRLPLLSQEIGYGQPVSGR